MKPLHRSTTLNYASHGTQIWSKSAGLSKAAVIMVAALTMLTLWCARMPMRGMIEPLLLVLAWIGVTIGVSVLICTALLTHSAKDERARSWRAGIAVLAMMVITFLAISSDLPLRIGLAVSEPDANRIARTAAASPNGRVASQWIGVYSAYDIEAAAGGSLRFHVCGMDFMDPHGFAYCPNGIVTTEGQHITGSWYRW